MCLPYVCLERLRNRIGIVCIMYTEALECDCFCLDEAISITYFGCVFVAIFIQHPMCQCYIILLSVEPVIEHAVVFQFSLQLFSETFLILRRIP